MNVVYTFKMAGARDWSSQGINISLNPSDVGLNSDKYQTPEEKKLLFWLLSKEVFERGLSLRYLMKDTDVSDIKNTIDYCSKVISDLEKQIKESTNE